MLVIWKLVTCNENFSTTGIVPRHRQVIFLKGNWPTGNCVKVYNFKSTFQQNSTTRLWPIPAGKKISTYFEKVWTESSR